MSTAITIRRATGADLAAAQAWLADAGLPIDDLTPGHMQGFLVAADNEVPVGMIGLEQFGNIGLLRSLVVDSTARSAGTGRALVDALESWATDRGVAELWLLTIDADNYFATLGYEVQERQAAPGSIRNSAEFSSLCPDDAVLMRKTL